MIISAHYPEVSQFETGESAYECGFFTAALQAAAGQAAPAESGEWVDKTADQYYIKFNGANTSGNHAGISTVDWYALLNELGIHYQAIGTSSSAILRGLDADHAVCVTVPETSVYDLELDKRSPYSWTPSGTHIITIVGFDSGQNAWLCQDTANIAPGGIRPWPRQYYAPWLQVNLATEITFAWQLNQPKTVTIAEGNTSWGLAEGHGLSLNQFLGWNLPTLDQAAQAHGQPSSNEGNLIYPGTVVRIG